MSIKCLNYSQLAALPKDTKIVLATRLADQIFEQFIEIGFENTYALSFEREAKLEFGMFTTVLKAPK